MMKCSALWHVCLTRIRQPHGLLQCLHHTAVTSPGSSRRTSPESSPTAGRPPPLQTPVRRLATTTPSVLDLVGESPPCSSCSSHSSAFYHAQTAGTTAARRPECRRQLHHRSRTGLGDHSQSAPTTSSWLGRQATCCGHGPNLGSSLFQLFFNFQIDFWFDFSGNSYTVPKFVENNIHIRKYEITFVRILFSRPMH
jgi:hypothetical protein